MEIIGMHRGPSTKVVTVLDRKFHTDEEIVAFAYRHAGERQGVSTFGHQMRWSDDEEVIQVEIWTD